MTALARYRLVRLAHERGDALTPEEQAEDALACDLLLRQADEMDPQGAGDDWGAAWRIVSAYNLARKPDETPV
jgi:hypothetical protein